MEYVHVGRRRSAYHFLVVLCLTVLFLYTLIGILSIWMGWTSQTLALMLIGPIPALIWLLAWAAFLMGVWNILRGNQERLKKWRVAMVGLMASVGAAVHIMVLFVMVTGFS
ncbi:MAG: hypothetical protein AB9860_04745 [Methanomassiliicoccales archaeon]